MNMNKLPEHQCPDCLAAIYSVREFPLGPRRGFYRAECAKCGWRGPKAITLSNVEYKNQYPCPYCNRSASGLAELRDHLLGCESFHAGQHQPIKSGWQPIETAPKDGTVILAITRGVVITAYWGRVGSIHNPLTWVGGHCQIAHIDQPTHWMPLPAAPVDTGEEEK